MEIDNKSKVDKLELEIKGINDRMQKLEIEIALNKKDFSHILEKQDKSMEMLEKLSVQVDALEKVPAKRYEGIVGVITNIILGAAVGYLLSGGTF